MKKVMFVLAALLFSAPAEAQLFRGRDRGDRVSVRIRSRSPRPRPVFYALPVYDYAPAYSFAPYSFAPRSSRFDLDLRLRSGRGGCVGGYCP